MAIEAAGEISLFTTSSAKRIASDALCELTSESVQNRLPAPTHRLIIYAAAE
jgi:hypothetical protein